MAKTPIKNIAKKLKTLGLYSGDLRKSITPGRKKYINSLYNKYFYLVNRPDEFVSTTVSKGRAERIEIDAYRIKLPNGKVKLFFKGQSVKIFKNRVRIVDGIFDEEVYDAKGFAIFTQAKKAFDNLKDDEYVTVRIGGNAPFKVAYDKNAYQLFIGYLTNWTPKDEGANKDELIDQMSIVRIARNQTKGKPIVTKKAKY